MPVPRVRAASLRHATGIRRAQLDPRRDRQHCTCPRANADLRRRNAGRQCERSVLYRKNRNGTHGGWRAWRWPVRARVGVTKELAPHGHDSTTRRLISVALSLLRDCVPCHAVEMCVQVQSQRLTWLPQSHWRVLLHFSVTDTQPQTSMVCRHIS